MLNTQKEYFSSTLLSKLEQIIDIKINYSTYLKIILQIRVVDFDDDFETIRPIYLFSEKSRET